MLISILLQLLLLQLLLLQLLLLQLLLLQLLLLQLRVLLKLGTTLNQQQSVKPFNASNLIQQVAAWLPAATAKLELCEVQVQEASRGRVGDGGCAGATAPKKGNRELPEKEIRSSFKGNKGIFD